MTERLSKREPYLVQKKSTVHTSVAGNENVAAETVPTQTTYTLPTMMSPKIICTVHALNGIQYKTCTTHVVFFG